MEFLKKNLFYVILAGATILLTAGSIFLLGMPSRAAIQDILSERQSLEQRIAKLKQSPVNSQMLEAQNDYNERVRASYENLAETAGDVNQWRWQPLVVPGVPTPEGPRDLTTFPVDKELYEQVPIIRQLFANVYWRAMDSVRANLSPAQLPTSDDYERERNKVVSRMIEESVPEDAESATILPAGLTPDTYRSRRSTSSSTPTPAGGDGGPLMPPGGAYPGGMPPGGAYPGGAYPGGAYPGGMPPGGPRSPRGSSGPPSVRPSPAATPEEAQIDQAEAMRRAEEILRVRTARDARLYVDPSAFDTYTVTSNPPESIENMWKATVNLWLHQYIADAINRANEADYEFRRQTDPDAELNIEQSAVKRLVSVAIGTADRGGRKVYVGEMDAPADDSGGRGRSSRSRDDDDEGVATLTERSCDTNHDVSLVTLELIMDPRRIPWLQRELMRENFVTVLNVNMRSLELEQESRSTPLSGASPGRYATPGARGDSVDESFYYYGPDPVMRVTLQIEVLFFPEWHRAMMPVEMLRLLPREALRPEDSERLSPGDAGDRRSGSRGRRGRRS